MNTVVQPLWDTLQMSPVQTPSAPLAPKAAESGEPLNPFTDIFRSAVEAVKETEANEVELEYLQATGQLDNPSLLTIAAAKADMAVDLLVQLRNQAMDAYNELTRISL